MRMRLIRKIHATLLCGKLQSQEILHGQHRGGLAAIDGADFVLVHDAARALASRELAASVVAALKSGDVAVIPGLPEVDLSLIHI